MNPKDAGFKMPAEWHPHKRCWMAWPSHEETWESIGLQRAEKAYAEIAKAIAEFEPVTMLAHPNDKARAAEALGDAVQLVTLPINDSWTRDTGPTFLLNSARELAGVDWMFNAWGKNYENYGLDTQIAGEIIERTHARYFHAPLVMEGGSFHVDGDGTILTTRQCLLNKNRNPNLNQAQIETYLKNYLGCEKIIWLDKGLVEDTTNGHIDEIACFIAPGKVLALISSDPADANYHTLQHNLNVLKNATDAKGRKIEVYVIEQPPATYLKGKRLTLSYINFYRANQGIVMPAFGYPQHDTAALQVFQNLFAGYKIKQVKALDVFAGGGGIHCITQQEPESISPAVMEN